MPSDMKQDMYKVLSIPFTCFSEYWGTVMFEYWGTVMFVVWGVLQSYRDIQW